MPNVGQKGTLMYAIRMLHSFSRFLDGLNRTWVDLAHASKYDTEREAMAIADLCGVGLLCNVVCVYSAYAEPLTSPIDLWVD